MAATSAEPAHAGLAPAEPPQADPTHAEPLPAGVRLLAISTVSGTLESFITPYARHFRALGWQVDAAGNNALCNPVVVAAFDGVYDLPLSRSLLDVRGLIKGRKAILDVIEKSRPDIVHVHTPIAGFLTRLAARQIPRSRRPAVVYTAHGFHFFKGGSRVTNAVFILVERIAGRWTDRLVVINEEDFAAAERHHIVARRKLLQTRGIGVDTDFYAAHLVAPQEIRDVRAALGVPDDAPMFLVPGELNRNKRQRDVVAALARIRHTEAHLVLAGYAASEEASLEQQISELGLRDRVHIAGFVRNFRPLILAANVVVLASSREGLARSIMEALSL